MRGKEVEGFGINSRIHEKCTVYLFPFSHLLWLLSAPFQSIPGGIITSQLGDGESIIVSGNHLGDGLVIRI
jgi:hypothetical protein